MDLDERVSAIVTGGASGLGAATASALRQRNVKVALFDINEEVGEEVARSMGALFCQADITSDASIDAALAKARGGNGQERILVNCAGGGKGGKTASRDRETGEVRPLPVASFERMVQLNLIGTFRCISKSAAGMMTLDPLADAERGAIINTGSVAAEDGQVGQVAYSASKAGIKGMTLTIARDLSSEGIRVNTILPGVMATPPMLGFRPDLLDRLAASVPFPKRLGRPEEFAALALTILSTVYFNGETVRLDGAIRMPPR